MDLHLFWSTIKVNLRILKVTLSLMNLENQLLLLKNRSNQPKTASQSRSQEIKKDRLRNKLQKLTRFFKKKRKKDQQLFWSMKKVNLKITRAKLLSMNLENQLQLLKNRSNQLKMVSPSRSQEIKKDRLRNKSQKLTKFFKKKRNKDLHLF